MIEFSYSIIFLTLKTEKFWKLSISFCPLVIVDISGKRTMRGCTCNPLAAWSMGSNRSCCPSHTRGQGWGWHHRVSNILILVEAVSQCISNHRNLGGQTRPQPLHWKTERQRDIGTWKLSLYFVSVFLMFTKQIWNKLPCMADGVILITTTNMPSMILW